jgi:hypothetical protein
VIEQGICNEYRGDSKSSASSWRDVWRAFGAAGFGLGGVVGYWGYRRISLLFRHQGICNLVVVLCRTSRSPNCQWLVVERLGFTRHHPPPPLLTTLPIKSTIGGLRRPFLSWISEFPTHRISMSINHWHPQPALNPETSKKE